MVFKHFFYSFYFYKKHSNHKCIDKAIKFSTTKGLNQICPNSHKKTPSFLHFAK